MKYTLPVDVYKPIENISEVEVMYDGGANSVSIAKIIWDGKETFGIRWNKNSNEKDFPTFLGWKRTSIGMPSVFGNPVWFILPVNDQNALSELQAIIQIFTHIED